jgi:glutamate racemase
MVRFGIFAWLFLVEFLLSFAHRLGDDNDDALGDDVEKNGEGAVVNFDSDDDSPPRLQHLVKKKDGTDLMKEFWDKASHTPKIVFADSGVGGLSIMSKFIEMFQHKPLFKNAKLIFYDTAGLNKDAHSATVKHILNEIDGLKPDLLFIACNGMSKIYLESDKAKDPTYPVIQMLPFAVELWGKKLTNDKGSAIVQFVSEFTGSTYVSLLAQKSSILEEGIDKNRIVVQTCQPAITAIQDHGPDSSEAKGAIGKCAEKAKKKLKGKDFNKDKTLLLGMGCTHFGWARKHWKTAIEEGDDVGEVDVLDPNTKMAQWLFDEKPKGLKIGTSAGDDFIEVAVVLRRKYKMDKIMDLVVEPLKAAIEAAKATHNDDVDE